MNRHMLLVPRNAGPVRCWFNCETWITGSILLQEGSDSMYATLPILFKTIYHAQSMAITFQVLIHPFGFPVAKLMLRVVVWYHTA